MNMEPPSKDELNKKLKQSFENSKINELDEINETLKFDESSHRKNKKYKTWK